MISVCVEALLYEGGCCRVNVEMSNLHSLTCGMTG